MLTGAALTADERRAFEFEAERMHRIELDFSLSEQQARERVRAQIPDLKPEEFGTWDAAGLLESGSSTAAGVTSIARHPICFA